MLAKTKEVLEHIANDELFKKYDIRFVGGTALSYLINHRLSEDLDFAALELTPKEIIEIMIKYGATKLEHNVTMEDYIKNDGEDINLYYIKFMLKGVKVEFFTPPFNLSEESIWKNDRYTYYENTTLKVASLDTIIYMKSMAFWNRKKYRDLFDIYYVIENKHITCQKFIQDYLEHNITYNTEYLHKKVQSLSHFFERANDEGINSLVTNPKPYDWYRAKIEEFIYNVLLDELYLSQ
jgi:predicted nucleotidyltransferase component of viral defense system